MNTEEMPMQFRYKTSDGRVLLPTIRFEYKCKKCEYLNELIHLAGAGRQFVDLNEATPYESVCHKCDDVEIITVEFKENT